MFPITPIVMTPIKISIPSLRVLLLDSSKKKIMFLKSLIRGLGLKGIEALSQRAESKGFQEVMKATVDVVISRATLTLDSLIPAGEPYLKRGGLLISMRGKQGALEVQVSRPYLDKLGLQVEKVEELSLPIV
jgi:16S rRNA (guanine527-N7)-methyltransferase